MSLLHSLTYNFIRPLAPDWFADRYRAGRVSAALAVEPYQVVSKIGVHCTGPRRSGFGSFLQTIKAAGRKVSVVKCRDDFGAAYEAKQYWPDVLTVGAFTEFDGLNFNAAKFLQKARLNPWIDYWEVGNEINGEWARQAYRYILLLDWMKLNGLRLALFSCASGTPPLPSEDGGIAYRAIAEACKYAVDNRHDAILCIHEYFSEGGTIGRYTNLADYLIERDAMLPIVISEWGYETHPGDAQLVAAIRATDPLYMADEWVEGCATWTLGGGGWGASNYERALPQMAQHIAAVPPIEIEPPDIVTVEVKIHRQYLPELKAWVNERGGLVGW